MTWRFTPPHGLLGEAAAEASPELVHCLPPDVISALLASDADSVAGEEQGRTITDRAVQRSGCSHRDLGTWIGAIDVASPKLRANTSFPEWLLERRERADSAPATGIG